MSRVEVWALERLVRRRVGVVLAEFGARRGSQLEATRRALCIALGNNMSVTLS